MRTLLTLAIAAVLVQVSLARTFSVCSLANELRAYNMPGTLENWVCIAQAESSMNTAAEGHLNTDGSVDYGLFQINSRYWCGPGNGCNLDCSALINDDISDDVACAVTIYNQMGYAAWVGWNNKCQGGLPDLSGC